MSDENQVFWHGHAVTRPQRETLNGHGGCVVWFTGLSGSGKSTIANEVDRQLHVLGVHTYLLDGDNVRHGLNAASQMLRERHGAEFAERFGLGFSAQDREENIRRVGAVAQLFCDAGLVTLTAFVSPYRRDRDAIRALLGEEDFCEVYVEAPLELCQQRDPKGLYKKARTGELRGMTGIDDPYEAPLTPRLVLDSANKDASTLAAEVIEYLRTWGKIPEASQPLLTRQNAQR